MVWKRKYVGSVLLAIFVLQSTAVFASGGRKNKETRAWPTPSRPVGRILPGAPQPRVVIKDYECAIDAPTIPGERVVLTTVGIEHEEAGEVEFHPFVSIAVDKTFPEAPDGQWLAVWNLGMKSPGRLSRMRALLPGFTARKRTREKELKKLEEELENFDEEWAEGNVTPPNPTLMRRICTAVRLSVWRWRASSGVSISPMSSTHGN